MPEWAQFLSAVGIASVLAAGLILLALRTFVSERIKAAIKAEYDQKLELHKSQLASQTAVEVERLRSQLNIVAAERQFRFSTLHQKRAEVIAEAYALLKRAHTALQEYLHIFQPAGSPPSAERQAAAVEAFNALRNFFSPNRIFVPERIAAKMDDIIAKFGALYLGFVRDVENAKDADNSRVTTTWVAVTESITNLSKTALFDLEQEFRKLLGDDVDGSE